MLAVLVQIRNHVAAAIILNWLAYVLALSGYFIILNIYLISWIDVIFIVFTIVGGIILLKDTIQFCRQSTVSSYVIICAMLCTAAVPISFLNFLENYPDEVDTFTDVVILVVSAVANAFAVIILVESMREIIREKMARRTIIGVADAAGGQLYLSLR
jgi:hypothetical protein